MKAKVTATAPIIIVADVVKAANYWRDQVGFGIDGLFNEPPTFAMVSRDGFTVMLAQVPAGAKITPNWRVAPKTSEAYIWVDDAASLYQEMQDRGAEIDFTLYDTPWGTREFGIQDLDDHDITFGQVLCPRASQP